MKKILNRFMKKYYLMRTAKQNQYENWITNIEKQGDTCKELNYQPKISILVPVYNVLDKHLIPCIESVLNQTYENWELCMADDCSTWKNVRKTLHKYEQNEKIKVVYRKENGHISRCTNSALEVATGEFVAFLDCDDVLAPNALYEVVKKLNENRNLDFIYSDEDKIDDEGKNRHMPHFKSDWAPDTLMAHMYTCHFAVYRRSIAVAIGGIRPGYEGAQDYDFTLRFTERTDKIAHISKILYHWRERAESTAGTPEAKPYILEAAKKSKEDALKRRGLKGELELIDGIYQYRVNYLCDEYPKVSVIIPSKDNYDILLQCIKSLCEITDYDNYEIVLVDNGSNEDNKQRYEKLAKQYNIQYIYEQRAFNFSYMCNLGARHADGEYLLFLNDDIEIIEPQWLKRMVGQASLKHVGAVGAKLLYPDRDTIQHVGVINIATGPVHALSGYSDEPIYYFGKNRMDYNQIAVTAACLLVNREKFDEIVGFNEDLAVAYNDIDLCFKLIEKGYYNVVRNDAILIHHESVSRGNDLESNKKFKRLMDEQEKLYKLHPQFKGKDPFYNVNLTQDKADFSCNDIKVLQTSNRKVKKWKHNIKGEPGINIAIDCVHYDKAAYIKGWFYWKNVLRTNFARMYLALKNEYQQTFYFEVSRMIRKDVAEALGNGAYNAGFECRIPYECLRLNAEAYQIGVVVEIPWLNVRRVNWTSWKLEKVSDDFYREKVLGKEFKLKREELIEAYKFNIEEFNRENGYIKGWALNVDSLENDYQDFLVAYQRDGKWYGKNAVRERRPDIAARYSTLTNAIWSGFESELPVRSIEGVKIVTKRSDG